MIPKLNANTNRFEERQNRKYTRFRKVRRPSDTSLGSPYHYKYLNGTFQRDIYSDIKRTTLIWTYARSILKYGMPAFLLHAIFFFLDAYTRKTLGDDYTSGGGGIPLVFIVYSICLFFAYRRISDHLAHLHVHVLTSKFSINQITRSHISHSSNIERDEELSVLEHYRKKYNKYLLFPSVKELAVEHQLYEEAQSSRRLRDIDYAEMRRTRLSLMSRREEHVAAKEIADWKQKVYGGENEYEELVKKYKYRTIPAVRDIIRDVQSSYT